MKYLTFLLIIGMASVASGAELRLLTLQQALAITLEKNRDIEKAREYGKYVQGRYLEERAAALPQLSLNSSLLASRDDSQPVMMGGNTTIYSAGAGVNFSQPLYTWGKIGAAIRAAEVGLKTADEELRLARQAALRDVATAFYDLLLAHEMDRIARENLEQKKRLAAGAHNRFDSGVATDYDVLVADVAVENARPEAIRTVNQVKIARERLRFFLALDGAEVDAVGPLVPETTNIPSLEEALLTAREKRPELLELRQRIGISSELVTIAAADNKPRLDLKGGGGWNSHDYGALTSSGGGWNIGVYLSFPFFDGFRTSGKVMQAESDLNTRRIEERKLSDAIALEVRTALYHLQEAQEIFSALSGTVRQAEKLLQMAEQGLEFGVKIRLEVDDAQLNLSQARGGLARAARDYQTARVNLAWATGRLGEE